MPNPQPRDLYIDQYLTNISIAYKNPAYIADQIFPIVSSSKQSGLLPLYDMSHWFRDGAELRAPRTKSRGGGFTVANSNYYCDRFSFRGEISDEERDSQDAPWTLDKTMTEFVMDKIALRREIAFANDFFKTGVWAVDKVGGTDFTKWSDYNNSSPFTDFTGFQDDIEGRIGREGTTLVLGKQAWNQLKWHPDLIESIKYTQKGILTLDLVASMLDIGKVLIGRSIKTTSPEGTAEASVVYTRIWGKNALLLSVPDSPSVLTPAAGYTFTWSRVPSSISYMLRFRDDQREMDILEGNSYFDQKVTSALAGEFLSNVVA